MEKCRTLPALSLRNSIDSASSTVPESAAASRLYGVFFSRDMNSLIPLEEQSSEIMLSVNLNDGRIINGIISSAL